MIQPVGENERARLARDGLKYIYMHIHILHTYIGTLSLSKNCTSRESVSPLSRLIRGFRNKYH